MDEAIKKPQKGKSYKINLLQNKTRSARFWATLIGRTRKRQDGGFVDVLTVTEYESGSPGMKNKFKVNNEIELRFNSGRTLISVKYDKKSEVDGFELTWYKEDNRSAKDTTAGTGGSEDGAGGGSKSYHFKY